MKLLDCINRRINKKGIDCKITPNNNLIVMRNEDPVIFLAIERKFDENVFGFHENNSKKYKQKYPKIKYSIVTQSKLIKSLLKKSKMIDRFISVSSTNSRGGICKIISEEINNMF